MSNEKQAPYMMESGDAREYIRTPLDIERARKKLAKLGGASADLFKFNKDGWQFLRKIEL